MQKLRVGVIGSGYLGKFHAEKYAAMDDVTLVGVADIDKAAAEKLAASLGTAAYTDYKKFFGRVDAVSIVVPTTEHYHISMDFLEKDVDIMVEKPITTTIEEADGMIDLAEKKGRIIQVGHLERFNPVVGQMKNIVGKPLFIEAHRLSLYKKRGTEVSVVLDLMIHDIDIILNFVKSVIIDIRAAGLSIISDHVDIASARIEFENGCVANITASRVSNRSERKIRIFQKNAYLSVDFGNSDITVVKKSETPAGNGPVPEMDTQLLTFDKWDALEKELRAFVDCVQHRGTPEVSGIEGRKALKTALAVMDKIRLSEKRFE